MDLQGHIQRRLWYDPHHHFSSLACTVHSTQYAMNTLELFEVYPISRLLQQFLPHLLFVRVCACVCTHPHVLCVRVCACVCTHTLTQPPWAPSNSTWPARCSTSPPTFVRGILPWAISACNREGWCGLSLSVSLSFSFFLSLSLSLSLSLDRHLHI